MTEFSPPQSFLRFAGFFHQDSDVVYGDLEYLIKYVRHHLSVSDQHELVEFAYSLEKWDEKSLERAWRTSKSEIGMRGNKIRELLLLIAPHLAAPT